MDGGFDQKTPISWDSILLIGVGMDKCRKYNPGKGKRKKENDNIPLPQCQHQSARPDLPWSAL